MKIWYGLIGAGALAVATITSGLAAPTASAPQNTGNTVPAKQAVATSHAGARHLTSRRRVETIQAALNNNGESVSVDGLWGAKTSAALRDFQQKHGLKATGHIDRTTLSDLKVTTRS